MKTSARLLVTAAAFALLLPGCRWRGGAERAEPPWVGSCGHLAIAAPGEPDTVPRLRERVEVVEPAAPEGSPPARHTSLLEIIVDAEGNVCDARVISPAAPEFDEPALAAVRQWTYTPATKGGTPVASRFVAAVEFGAPPREEEGE